MWRALIVLFGLLGAASLPAQQDLKVHISVDLEGIAGVVDAATAYRVSRLVRLLAQ